jgi:ribosome-binding protein aMBF1 (putative translation factor)
VQYGYFKLERNTDKGEIVMKINYIERKETDLEKAARLGEAIRTARREFGWSLGAVARVVGVRTSYLSSIERGKLPLYKIEGQLFGDIMRTITNNRIMENGNCKNND